MVCFPWFSRWIPYVFFSFGGIHQVELLHSSAAKGGVWGVSVISPPVPKPHPQRVKTTWPKAVTDHAPSAQPGTSNWQARIFVFFFSANGDQFQGTNKSNICMTYKKRKKIKIYLLTYVFQYLNMCILDLPPHPGWQWQVKVYSL